MNEALQTFIYILGGLVIIFIIIFAYFAFVVIVTLNKVRQFLDNIDLVKRSAMILKQGTVLSILDVVSKFLKTLQGGDKYGQK